MSMDRDPRSLEDALADLFNELPPEGLTPELARAIRAAFYVGATTACLLCRTPAGAAAAVRDAVAHGAGK